jgi:hypothetical protein
MTLEKTQTDDISKEVSLEKDLYSHFLHLCQDAETKGKRYDLATWTKDLWGKTNVYVPVNKEGKNGQIFLYGHKEIEDAIVTLVTELTGDKNYYLEFLEATQQPTNAEQVKHESHHDEYLFEWQSLRKAIIGIKLISDNHGVSSLTWYIRGTDSRHPTGGALLKSVIKRSK